MDTPNGSEVNGIESERGIEAQHNDKLTAAGYGVSEATGDKLNEEIARLRAENEALKRKASETKVSENNLTFKVSEKGGVSVYGLGRFPVTLYMSQWERLEKAMPQLRDFIGTNSAVLKVKEKLAEGKTEKEVAAIPPTIRRAVNGGNT